MDTPSLGRRLLAEFLGTMALLATVTGVSIMAAGLSPGDAGLRLLENSSTVALGLAAIIFAFGPVSGAHFNPVVSAADWFLGRRTGTGLTTAGLAGYVGAQIGGATVGAVLGNLMFDRPAVTIASTVRSGGHLLLSEVVATTGLLVLIAALVRTGRGACGPGAVGAYIGAACWFTSSTCFANPAVTLGRMLTGAEAGIAPASVPAFLGAQFLGLVLACGLAQALYPRPVAVRSEHPAVTPPAPRKASGPGRRPRTAAPWGPKTLTFETLPDQAGRRPRRRGPWPPHPTTPGVDSTAPDGARTSMSAGSSTTTSTPTSADRTS